MFLEAITTVLLLCLAAIHGIPKCPGNEIYETCGTACPATCLNWNVPRICEDICMEGCFCRPGYVRRGENGPCVPLGSCIFSIPMVKEDAVQCQENEEFSDCATLCPLTCEDDGTRLCPDICIKGCVCKEGFIRKTTDGPCVSKDTCIISDPACTANQEYRTCGSACPATCNEPVRACEKVCIAGCFCQEGFILDDLSGECVKLESCPNRLLFF